MLSPDYAPSGTEASLARPTVPFPADDSGFVVVDKPLGLTSQQVVSRLRRIFGLKKIGHTGTLDPAASGILVCALGRATRLISVVQGAPKSYRGRVVFGVTTSTEDAQGEVTSSMGASLDDVRDRLGEALEQWRGEVDQRPSSVSAIKVQGRRAYARVRAGEDVTLPPRRITISALDVVDGPWPSRRDGVDVVECDIAVTCSAGTYIRALARDLGDEIGCGAHLSALRRTTAACFDIGDAMTIDAIAADVSRHGVTEAPCVRATGQVLAGLVPSVRISEEQRDAVALGRALTIDPGDIDRPAGAADGAEIALIDRDDRVAALARCAEDGSGMQLKPHVVLATARKR
nr:tRNA pseudouridine(55) synthase TruB [Nanchangia anserum]